MNDVLTDALVADEELPPADISLVFLVSEGRAELLPAVLEEMQSTPRLRGVPVAIVCGPETEMDVQTSVEAHEVSLVSAISSSDEDLATAACDWLESAPSRYGSVAVLPTVGKLTSWSRRVLREVDGLAEVPLETSTPLLVWTDRGTKRSVALYIHRTLMAHDVERGSLLGDYLGRLALAAANPLLEAVDPLEGDIELLGFLAAQFVPAMIEPPWRYRVALTGPSGDVVRSEPMALTPRKDGHGVVRWEALTVRLPLAGVGDGHRRMVIEVDTEVENLRLRRNLRPRRGALISARTVSMPVNVSDALGEERESAVRYLLHTVGDGTATFLTTQVGSGLAARLKWAGMLYKKDAGFIARGPAHWRMRWLRLLRLVTRPFFAGREIWLIGERTDTAQDNGVHLFRHLRETRPRQAVYYVIDRSSPQYERVASHGKVVAHSSWLHQLLMLHATVLANAYSIRYFIPSGWGAGDYTRHIVWRVGALRVYLKHGVHLSPDVVKRGTTGYDVCLTVMPGETAALRSGSGYDTQLVEAGMPRYDALSPTPPSRTILFMPTWRKYLVTKVLDGAQEREIPYEGSRYERFMSGMLESRRLHDMLDKYGYKLLFVPHYNMASRFVGATVAGERIEIADTNEMSFQDLIRGCDAFVTDYSSVHFDVAYIGTPIVYARFDEDDFETKHSSPSWFDYERDGFGPVVRTLDQTLEAVEDLLKRDCRPDPYYQARIDAAFPLRDNQNCARTVAAIEQRIPRRQLARGAM